MLETPTRVFSMLPLEQTLLMNAAFLLHTNTGRISADALTRTLTTCEEERIALRRVLPILGWRRLGGAYWRYRRTPLLTIREGQITLFTPPSPSSTEITLRAAFGDMVGTVTNYDAWKATRSTEPYTAAAKRSVALAMRNLGFERRRLRADRKVSIVYVRGDCIKDRRRPIYVHRSSLTGEIQVTYDATQTLSSLPLPMLKPRRFHR
jgi:hypothetical protein